MPQDNRTGQDAAPASAASARGVEPWFAYTVGVLLLVIVAALTGLTLRLHRRTRVLEADLRDAQTRLRDAEQSVQILGESIPDLSPRLPREALRRSAVTLNGQATSVLELPAATGRTWGLRPGDVVRVSPPTGEAAGGPGPAGSGPADKQGT